MITPARLLLLALAVTLPLSWPAPAAAAAHRTVAIGPAPAWVEPTPLPDAPVPSTTDASGSVAFLLVDDQVRRGPAGREHYRRMVQQVVTTPGIEEASELRVDFDPDYQRVTLHDVTIRRGKARRQALRPADVKVIQREEELDKRIYDGRLTAVVFLRDVRVGDVVDSTWTVHGQNPVYDGRTALGFDLGWGVPVGRLSVRVLWPADRPLGVRVHGDGGEPTRTVRGGEIEYRLSRSPAPAVVEESDLPAGVETYPWLELSEWATWEDVVGWALPIYTPGPPSAAMAAKLAEWRALPDEASRVQAALRFVQDEIRYLGIELGTGSHRPSTPGEVLQRRFGDCKDKSLLLVALLRGLGVDAAPALVNTESRAGIERRLPSPKAFDHVVVRAVVGGKERWLEPTRSLERGPLETLVTPAYRRALVLAPGERGLTTMPEPAPSLVEVKSNWKVARWTDPVAFEVVTRYEGLQALSMRHDLADTTPARLQQRYLEHYARDEPGVEVAAPIVVEDAPDADRVTITERYRLPAAKEGVRRDFAAEAIQERLSLPKTSRRTMPLRVPFPVLVRERLELELPGRPDIGADEKLVASDAVRLTRKARLAGQKYVVDFEYQTLKAAVEPAAVAGHLAKIRDMQDIVSFSLPMAVVKPAPKAAAASQGRTLPRWAIYLAIGGALLLVRGAISGLRIARTWGQDGAHQVRTQAFFKALVERPGETARTPISLRSREELPGRVRDLRCRCGAPIQPVVTDGEPVLVGDRQVNLARAPCGRCGQLTTVYFVVG